MSENGEYRRFKTPAAPQKKRGRMKPLVISVMILMIWLALVIAAMIRAFGDNGPDPVVLAVLFILGGFGVLVIGRDIVKKVRDRASGP